MKRINAVPYVIMITLCILSVVQLFAKAQTGQSTSDGLQAYGFPPTSDPNGGWTPRKNVAAYQWCNGAVVPARLDWQVDPATGSPALKWPILAHYKEAWRPSIVWYYDNGDGYGKKYRSSNGSRWSVPERWSYVRMEEEVWNAQMQRMEIPGLHGSPTPAPPATPGKAGVHMDNTQGQWAVDDLKRSFTTAQIQDFIDASPYDEPDTGAPEPQS